MRARHFIIFMITCLLLFGLQSEALAKKTSSVGKLLPSARFDQADPDQMDLSLLRPYFDNSQILPSDLTSHLPYVLSPEDEHLISGRADAIYARGVADSPRGTYWQVVRIEKPIRDPVSHHVLGTLARANALAKMAVPGRISKLWLSETQSEIHPGDRLLPPDTQVDQAVLFPYHPEFRVEGLIVNGIAEEDELGEIGRFRTVIINRGERVGLHPGALLNIYKPGQRVYDHVKEKQVRLPNEVIGKVLVYRVFDQASMGLVINTTAPIHPMDRVSSR